MLGLLERIDLRCNMAFQREGDLIVLIGGSDPPDGGLGGSEYLAVCHNLVAGRPSIDLDLERRVQQCCLDAIQERLLRSAHDCSDGGLAVALAECCIAGRIGADLVELPGRRLDAVLFGEVQSRMVVSLPPEGWNRLQEIAARHGVPVRLLGRVGGDRFRIAGTIDVAVEEMECAWRGGLENALRGSVSSS